MKKTGGALFPGKKEHLRFLRRGLLNKPLCFLRDGFVLPAAHAVEDQGECHAAGPADQQGVKQHVAAPLGQGGRSGQPDQQIGQRHPDTDGLYDGEPHGSDCVSGAAHNAEQGLRDGKQSVARGNDLHEPEAQLDQFRRVRKNSHQVFSEEQYDHGDGCRDDDGEENALAGAFFHALHIAGSYVLPGEGRQGDTEGKGRQNDESIHAHDDDVGRDELFSKGIGQGLYQDHRHGEDRLGDAGGQSEPDDPAGKPGVPFQEP